MSSPCIYCLNPTPSAVNPFSPCNRKRACKCATWPALLLVSLAQFTCPAFGARAALVLYYHMPCYQFGSNSHYCYVLTNLLTYLLAYQLAKYQLQLNRLIQNACWAAFEAADTYGNIMWLGLVNGDAQQQQYKRLQQQQRLQRVVLHLKT